MKKWDLKYDVVDLHNYGINNYAFDIPSAIAFICENMMHGVIILGGDIILSENGDFTESYDNWYCDEKDPIISAQKAIDYLRYYFLKNINDLSKYSVTIVTSDLKEFYYAEHNWY